VLPPAWLVLIAHVDNQMKPSTATASATPGHGQPLVFAVDDEPMLLELVALVLQPLGFRVRMFRDPGAALRAFEAARPRPDLIVTDYAMHTMNGMDLIRTCRQIEPRQRILMVSGTVDETIYRDLPDKPDRFLAKPYSAHQLAAAVRGTLDRTSAAGQPD
jgi:CheY-like chemotaxis protein